GLGARLENAERRRARAVERAEQQRPRALRVAGRDVDRRREQEELHLAVRILERPQTPDRRVREFERATETSLRAQKAGHVAQRDGRPREVARAATDRETASL